ncbi:MAG: PrsW family glutamic-type intramembrane protease [Chitinophagales bacterium]|nr:PrsW family glutamic-type intramembrane protease [Chitinophagales bacterium]
MSLLALALAPGFAIMLYIYLKDKHEREPLGLLIKCFIAGIFSTVPAVILSRYGSSFGYGISDNPWITFVYAYGVVAFSEELSKFAMVYWFAYRNKNFNEPFDGIVYSVMVSMGFATLENILYVNQYGYGTGIMRMFTAVPAHASFAVVMGYFLGKAKYDTTESFKLKLFGLLGAVLLHGSYDYSLFEIRNYPLALLGAVISLALGIRLSRKAMREHQLASPFRFTKDKDIIS